CSIVERSCSILLVWFVDLCAVAQQKDNGINRTVFRGSMQRQFVLPSGVHESWIPLKGRLQRLHVPPCGKTVDLGRLLRQDSACGRQPEHRSEDEKSYPLQRSTRTALLCHCIDSTHRRLK